MPEQQTSSTVTGSAREVEPSATVNARPLSFEDIAALAPADATSMDAFVCEESMQHGLTLTPVTITPAPLSGRSSRDLPVPHRPVHAAVLNERPNAAPGTYRVDKDTVVGFEVRAETTDLFSTQRDMTFFTSADAETATVRGTGHVDPSRDRAKVFVLDPAGEEFRLTPVHGAQVSAGFIVTGMDAEVARTRAEAVLRAEFGDALRPQFKLQARPVAERRVNVYTSAAKEQILAANILGAEISYYMRGGSAYSEDWDPNTVMG